MWYHLPDELSSFHVGNDKSGISKPKPESAAGFALGNNPTDVGFAVFWRSGVCCCAEDVVSAAAAAVEESVVVGADGCDCGATGATGSWTA